MAAQDDGAGFPNSPGMQTMLGAWLAAGVRGPYCPWVDPSELSWEMEANGPCLEGAVTSAGNGEGGGE